MREMLTGAFGDRWGDYLMKLCEGLVVTVELNLLALGIGLVLAILLALALISPNRALRWPAKAYVFFFRGTPLLVQIFLIYYGLGLLIADWIPRPERADSWLFWFFKDAFRCGALALALNTAAYTAEIFRGGMAAVPAGEIEAARALGMSRRLALRRIVWPRAFRLALPAYGNEIVLLVKGSALVSTITVLDLMGVAIEFRNRTFLTYESFALAGAFYLVLIGAITLGLRALEKRLHA